MMKSAVLTPQDGLWRYEQLFTQEGPLVRDEELPKGLASLEDVVRKMSLHRTHLRFEDGKLIVGSNDKVYDIVGVPHCGNRYTQDLLKAFGEFSEILHLRVRDNPIVIPIRDPSKCLLSHWKKTLEINDFFVSQFVSMWDDLEKIKDKGTIFFVDRDPPEKLMKDLGLEGAAPTASKHAHFLSDKWVSMVNPPQEVREICQRWGY